MLIHFSLNEPLFIRFYYIQPSEEKTVKDIIWYQDTIALQILIEWILLIENETDDLPTIIQIRKKIFTFLHSTFCKNKSLLQVIYLFDIHLFFLYFFSI